MLSNIRLKKIADYIPYCGTVADIGSDHGKLGVELVLSGKAKHIIASDISEESLAKSICAAKRNGVSDKISCVLADGLDAVSDDADCIVIAGMGGRTIAGIIGKDAEKVKASQLVLCPHTEPDVLRKFLADNGFVISKEECIFDSGHYYMIICAAEGDMTLTEKDMLLGNMETVVCNSDYLDYLFSLKKKYENEISVMKKGGASSSDIDDKNRVLEIIRERIVWLNP